MKFFSAKFFSHFFFQQKYLKSVLVGGHFRVGPRWPFILFLLDIAPVPDTVLAAATHAEAVRSFIYNLGFFWDL
jgi:hypothetical protein